MNIYIGEPVEVNDMQGPCPSGFHVPTKDEWQAIKDAGVTIGAWTSNSGDNCSIYLKMPYCGMRNDLSNVSSGSVGAYGNYWSSTYYSEGSGGSSLRFMLYPSGFVHNASFISYGLSIRGMKTTPAIPDSSWIVLYQGAGSAGIYWNQTEGLISISSNGTTWYTLMDKNLGATTVWNSGDTLTDANCGNVFQRGNNYGFPGTLSSDSITTSSTTVNVAGYGPGNYYSSSTWITVTPRRYGANANLRGGVSQGTSTKSVELQNIYIGEYVPPYLCFTANTAGSTVQLTKTGSPTSVTLETSTDLNTWTTYTFGTTITLANIGDKVYWRNTSTTDTGFNLSNSAYYKFVMTGSIAASGDVNFLLNKNSTTTASSYCYNRLFYQCTSLTTTPELPATTLSNACYNYMFYGCTGLTSSPALTATTLGDYCYNSMFYGCTGLTSTPTLPATTLTSGCYANMFNGCTSLTTLPSLPATTLRDACYQGMFRNCSKIKLSTTQTGAYQTAYRIPTTGTGTEGNSSLDYMFGNTGGAFAGTPTINTTYYTSNTVV